MVKTKKELIFEHAMLHYWYKNPSRTDLTKKQLRTEHDRIVKLMKKKGINHNSPLN